jgi:hypothetical protein
MIAGNAVTATGEGTVSARGGGIVNVEMLTLRDSDVTRNAVRARGRDGTAQGGGIWNGLELEEFPPQLSAFDSAITRNAVTASRGIEVVGGGLFTSEPVTLTRTELSGNRPDECAGC